MDAQSKFSSLYDAVLALVYPRVCECCGSSVESRIDGVACSACWDETHIIWGDDTLCVKCGAVAGTASPGHPTKWRCGRCDEDEFDAARACGLYEGALRSSILSLKREPHISRRVADLLCEAGGREPLVKATRIVPVPLHPEREKERGFNQSVVIARTLARCSGLALSENVIKRTEHTGRHRAGMDARSRKESVAGVFEVRSPRLISGESLLLVDDVYTTGATVSACAKALKSAGAVEIFVLTIARSR